MPNVIIARLFRRLATPLSRLPQRHRLRLRDHQSLSIPGTATIASTDGTLWLTHDGRDIILPAGQTYRAKSPCTPIVITPLTPSARFTLITHAPIPSTMPAPIPTTMSHRQVRYIVPHSLG